MAKPLMPEVKGSRRFHAGKGSFVARRKDVPIADIFGLSNDTAIP
jgi:hypothetical protein